MFVCLQSTQINCVLKELSIILEVPPPRLLLLRDDKELPLDSTVGELGLGIADIIGGSCDGRTRDRLGHVGQDSQFHSGRVTWL